MTEDARGDGKRWGKKRIAIMVRLDALLYRRLQEFADEWADGKIAPTIRIFVRKGLEAGIKPPRRIKGRDLPPMTKEEYAPFQRVKINPVTGESYQD